MAPSVPGSRVEQGEPAGGEAVLLVRVEHGLILWLPARPWRRNTESDDSTSYNTAQNTKTFETTSIGEEEVVTC
jgi:hypothetical protein